MTGAPDVPAPFTPADCNLRDLSFMPLDALRLRDSDQFILSTGDEFKAAVALWCKSWHQVPAASLPRGEAELAVLAGYGRDVEGWAEVRDRALHGFVLCSDGRLYHRALADLAQEAWRHRQMQREQAARRREKRNTGTAKEARL